jgi:subfamily B ATP-binding cassette protein MsbA
LPPLKDLRKLLRFVAAYRWNALGNVLLNLGGVVFSVVSIAFIAPFLDLLFNTANELSVRPAFSFSLEFFRDYFRYSITHIKYEYGPVKAIAFVGTFIFISILLKNLFVYSALYVITPMRQGIVRDYRNKIYSKILRLPISYFNNERKGDLLSRFANDIAQIEWSALMALESVFKEPLTILVTLVCLVFISVKLSLIVLLLLPVSGIIITGIGRILRREAKVIQGKVGQLLSLLEESISGIRIIKAFHNEGAMYKRFFRENNEIIKRTVANNRRADASSPISEVLGIMTVIVLLYFGGRMVLKGEIGASTFIIYLGLFAQVISPSKALSNAWNLVKRGSASMDRIEEILNAEEVISNKPDARKLDGFHESIAFRNVSFKYKDEYVVRNLSLKINKGSTVALVGPSGSGKSTLADLIPRFYDVQEGEVLIDGVNVKDFDTTSLRSVMGIVTQETLLFNDTIRNNITFGMPGKTDEEILEAARVAHAIEFISDLPEGLDANIGERGSKLSGGQRQRLSIARAVLKNPDILILDEATSALDQTSERLVQAALNNLMKDRTSIVIAHRLSTVQHADLIVVLGHGEILQMGTHEDLLKTDGVYRELYTVNS